MRLTDLFHNNNIRLETNENVRNMESFARANEGANPKFAPGQVVEGEVVARKGNEVQLRLTNDILLLAKVDQDVHVDLGKTLFFEVKSGGNNVNLSPLFTNTATKEPVLLALDMANIPTDEKTVEMTGQMMKAGMSVDKNVLQAVYRDIKAFPNAAVQDIVDLHRLGLEVNESSVNQIANYKNFSHQLLDGMNQIAEDIPAVLDELANDGEYMEAGRLLGQLMSATLQGIDEENMLLPKTGVEQNVIEENEPDLAQGAIKPQNEDNQVPNHREIPGEVSDEKNTVLEGNQRTVISESPQTIREALADILNNRELTDVQKLEQLTKLVQEKVTNGDEGALRELVKHKGVKGLLQEQLRANFTISPKELESPKKVEDLYERLDRQLKGFTKAFEDVGKTDTSAYKAVSNMNQNLDFLHQMNQVYNYVQLPLRFQQSQAHGDLYVYTNKKNLAQKEGEISALLHLDMEHLGPVDVYVAMEQAKVKTNFYVQDDEMLSFLEEHMDLLTKRLENRGYQLSVKTQVRENANEEKQRLGALGPLQPEVRETQLLQKLSFDVRA